MPTKKVQTRIAMTASAAMLITAAACTAEYPDLNSTAPDYSDGPVPAARYTQDNVIQVGMVKTLRNAPQPWTSGHAMAVTERHIYAIDADNHALVVLERASGEILHTIPTGARPDQVVVGPDGAAFVSVRGEGKVIRVERDADTISAETVVGLEPTGLSMTHDGRLLLVALWGEGNVVVLNSDSMDIVDNIQTVERPRAITVNSHGMVNVVGDSATRVTFNINDDDRHLRARSKALKGLRDSPGASFPTRPALALSVVTQPDTGRPLITHQVVSPGTRSTEFIEPYYGDFNSDGSGPTVATVDHDYAPPKDGDEDDASHTTTDPTWTVDPITFNDAITIARDINHHPFVSMASVVGMASDTVVLISTQGGPTQLYQAKTGPAPTATAFSPDGRHLYVLNSHDLTISEFTLDLDVTALNMIPTLSGDTDTVPPITVARGRTFTIGHSPLSQKALLGRRLFTASMATLGSGSATSCQSCHYEGLDDAIIRSGVEGLRQTPMLAGRLHQTAPYAWMGSNDRLQDHIAKTMARLGHHTSDDEDIDAISDYLLNHLPEPSNPTAIEGLSDSARRGRVLFEDPAVGCANCHGGAASTDNINYDVGTYSAYERELDQTRLNESFINKLPDGLFNTPSLKHLRYSAPYFHDGSAATLEDVLDMTDGTMGHTGHLSEDERDDLLAYLRTL